MNRLLVLFGYPNGSAAALLAGVLPLWYCSPKFACKFPTWELPVRGHVREKVTESGVDGQVPRGDRVCHVPLPGSAGVILVYSVRVGFSVVLKEFDSTEKHQHTLQDLVVWEVSRLVPEFGRDSGLLSLIGVLSVALKLCTSVIMVMAGLLWVTGLELGRIWGCSGPRLQALHEGV